MPELERVNLDKSYGDLHALREMGQTVESGEIFGFVGSNGAQCAGMIARNAADPGELVHMRQRRRWGARAGSS